MQSFKTTEISKKLKALQMIDLSKNDKLSYCVKKNIAEITSAIESLNKKLGVYDIQNKYASDIESLNIKYTSVDTDGNIFIDDNGRFLFKFTRENLLLRNAEMIEIEAKANSQLEKYQDEFITKSVSIELFKGEKDGDGWDRVKDLDLQILEELQGFLF